MTLRFVSFAESASSELLSWIRNENDLVLWSGDTFSRNFNGLTFSNHLKRTDIHPFSYYDTKNNLMAYGEVLIKASSCTICRVIVNPGYRDKGIGQRFCIDLIRWIKTKTKAKSISLNTFAENLKARTCYQKIGFEEIEKYSKNRHFSGKCRRVIVMKMVL